MSRPCRSLMRPSRSFSKSLLVSPSTPLAPYRFICFQVSLGNSGPSKCVSDVKRSFPSVLAFAAILPSSVDILSLPLSAEDVPLRKCGLVPPLPHVAGFPNLRVLSASPTPAAASAFLRIVSLSVGVLRLLRRPRRASQVPRRSFSDHAVLSDPAGVSGNLALLVAYCSLPGVGPCRPPDLDHHEAQSLHFRYGLVVALPTLSPRRYQHRSKARFPVGG